MCHKACVRVRCVRGVFHMLGTRAGWWACCPHILGTCRSHPRHVPHAWDSACPSHMSRTHRGHVPHTGDMFSVFPGCGGSVPTMWHMSPACGTRAEPVLDMRLGCAPSRACATCLG